MLAHVCASLGWSWDVAREQLDIPRLKALNAYWDRNPPTHLLVKNYLGYKPGPTDAPSAGTTDTSAGGILDALIEGEP